MKLLLVTLLCGSALAESTVRVELFTGAAVNVATPLTIQQVGQPTINVAAANYVSGSFNAGSAPYYSVRVGLWNSDQDSAWELELLHDKLYLTNLPPEVQQFQLTFGYNMLFINRAWALNDHFNFRVGVGPVIAHPISTVNGQAYDGPMYSLCGIAYQLALQARTQIYGPISGTIETKWTGASATVPIANGEAVVPNNGVHFLIGIGVDF